MSAEHTYKFNVSMSCGGCSGAVNRVLGKLDGMLCPLQLSTYPSALFAHVFLHVSALLFVLPKLHHIHLPRTRILGLC
jgi:copper chaperone